MRKLHAIIFSTLIISSSLAGCLGDAEEFDTSELDKEISDLQKNQDEMNQTLEEQLNSHAELVLVIEELNSDNTLLLEMIADKNNTIMERNTLILEYIELINSTNQQVLAANLNLSNMQLQLSNVEEERNTLLGLLSESNSTNDDLTTMLQEANETIIQLQSDIITEKNLVEYWQRIAQQNIADLGLANLEDADLEGARLSGANLTSVQLQNAFLINSDLSRANLYSVNLGFANLANANLSDSNLTNSSLVGASFAGANLSGAVLEGAIMTFSSFYGANLSGVIMEGLDMNHTSTANVICPLSLPSNWSCVGPSNYGSYSLVGPYARLGGADFTGIDLSNLDLSLLDTLEWVDFTDANLSGVNLGNVPLDFVNFSNTNLTGATIYGNGFWTQWNNTICPDGTNSDDNGNTCDNNMNPNP